MIDPVVVKSMTSLRKFNLTSVNYGLISNVEPKSEVQRTVAADAHMGIKYIFNRPVCHLL